MLNPFLTLTLQMWDSYRSEVVNSPSMATVFMGQSWFPPALGSKDFLIWRTHGIVRIWDVMQKGKFLAKSRIERKYNIEIPWFQYCQLHDLFVSYHLKVEHNTDLTGFEALLINDVYRSRVFCPYCIKTYVVGNGQSYPNFR